MHIHRSQTIKNVTRQPDRMRSLVFMVQTSICARSSPDACRSTAIFPCPPFDSRECCDIQDSHGTTRRTSGRRLGSSYSVVVLGG
jgi:hypothetical protein